jgi:hypothetical protein
MRGAVPLVRAIGLVGVACGSDDGGTGGGSATDERPRRTVGTTTSSSPFSVEHPPEGHQLVLAGKGDIRQTWSSDSSGDDEPVTVPAPLGAGPNGPDIVTVSLTGYAGSSRSTGATAPSTSASRNVTVPTGGSARSSGAMGRVSHLRRARGMTLVKRRVAYIPQMDDACDRRRRRPARTLPSWVTRSLRRRPRAETTVLTAAARR